MRPFRDDRLRRSAASGTACAMIACDRWKKKIRGLKAGVHPRIISLVIRNTPSSLTSYPMSWRLSTKLSTKI